MSEAHGVCAGCYRTLDEIARWPEMSDRERVQVIKALGQRRRTFGELLVASERPPP
jgi:predicted Fe-S protein YdhL (DUF1289 family)